VFAGTLGMAAVVMVAKYDVEHGTTLLWWKKKEI